MLKRMQSFNLTVAFILEIIAFLGFVCIGFLFPLHEFIQFGLSIILLCGLVVVWGNFMSPKAPKKVSLSNYYLIKGIIYGIATLVIFQTYSQTAGVLFIFITAVNEAMLYSYNKKQFPPRR